MCISDIMPVTKKRVIGYKLVISKGKSYYGLWSGVRIPIRKTPVRAKSMTPSLMHNIVMKAKNRGISAGGFNYDDQLIGKWTASTELQTAVNRADIWAGQRKNMAVLVVELSGHIISGTDVWYSTMYAADYMRVLEVYQM